MRRSGNGIVAILEALGLEGFPLFVAAAGIAALIVLAALWLANRPFKRKPR